MMSSHLPRDGKKGHRKVKQEKRYTLCYLRKQEVNVASRSTILTIPPFSTSLNVLY